MADSLSTKTIGITGGVGCGKSTILEYLAKREDSEILQADLLAKDLERRGGPCYEPLLKLFGKEILDKEGEISAPKLAKRLFSEYVFKEL